MRLSPVRLSLWLTLSLACATSVPHAPPRFELARPAAPAVDRPRSLEDYVALAAQTDPALRATHARWRAAHARASAATPWPRPVISYAAFIRPVETRVGPQRQRIGLRVPIAWGGPRRAARDAANWMTSGQGRAFTARLLDLRAEVADLYWSIWAIDREIEEAAHEAALLGSLEEASRVGLEVGRTPLSNVQMLTLRRALADDKVASLRQQRAQAVARLSARVGSPGLEIEVLTAPPEQRDPPNREELIELVRARPMIAAREDAARGLEARATQYERSRLPDLSLQLDYIDVGPARMDGVEGSGRDALAAGFSIGVPVDGRVLAHHARAARADADAARADAEASVRDIGGEVDAALAALEDSRRRARLFQNVLAGQAEAAFESSLNHYATHGVLSDVLSAVDALIDVRRRVHRALADHALTWAKLERLAGAPLWDTPSDNDAPDATELAAEAAPSAAVSGPDAPPEPTAPVDVSVSGTEADETPAPRRRRARPVWTCTMHPEIHEPHAGPCPICGMPLVRREGESQ